MKAGPRIVSMSVLVALVTGCSSPVEPGPTPVGESSPGAALTDDVFADDPCALDLDIADRRVPKWVDEGLSALDARVRDGEPVLQGGTYDHRRGEVVVAVDPAAEATEGSRGEVTQLFNRKAARPALRFRAGCYPNAALEKVKATLLAGDWLGGVNAAFAVAYGADDGRLILYVEPRAAEAAARMVRQFSPYVRLAK